MRRFTRNSARNRHGAGDTQTHDHVLAQVRYKEDPQYADKDGLDTDKAVELLKEVAASEDAEHQKQQQ